MRVARAAGVVVAAQVAVAGALTPVLLAGGQRGRVNALSVLLVVTAYAFVAVVICLARPGHLVGRLMLGGACVWGAGEGLLALAARDAAQGAGTM